MLLKKLTTIILTLLLITSCGSARIVTKTNPITTVAIHRELAEAPSCDVLLEKCSIVVESQRRAIKEQQDVIVKQEEIIQHAEKEIESAHEDVNNAILGGAGVSGFLLLLLLL